MTQHHEEEEQYEQPTGTAYQASLLEEAHEYWDQGKQLPIVLFARLAQEGLDVETLESKHRKEI